MGRLMDDVVSRKPPMVRFSPRTWQPPIDVYETDGEVVVLVELAGVKEDEIEVIVHDNILIVRGERRDIKQGIRRTYSQMEILWGPFEREIILPTNVNVERIKAFYDRGFLEIVLPKLGDEEPRHIDIKMG
jgi:Molecular chaperone (small heat shock protein)